LALKLYYKEGDIFDSNEMNEAKDYKQDPKVTLLLYIKNDCLIKYNIQAMIKTT